jgi:cytoskeletal protein CcmA (bactofilin family)
MFNKPTLFPKSPEPQPARGGRLVPGAQSTPGSAFQSEGNVVQRDTGTSANSSSSAVGQPSSAAGVAATQVDAGKSSDSRLIVGPEVKLKGAEILDCDTLVVEGRVEATMDSRVIRIAENGAFSGTVGIDVAEIHGQFDGELTARSQLIIHATGRVSGKIRYGRIFIEEGGQISGDVKALDAASAATKSGEGSSSAASTSPAPVQASA